MASLIDASEILQRHCRTVEPYLLNVLRRNDGAPSRLIEAVRYSLTAGGKRLRPVLVLEAFEACGGVAAAHQSALAAAGAIELIHTFSLVHDDLPAMDNDDLRRGKPTNHKIFGEGMAILAGDAMVALAFEILARDAEPTIAAPLMGELARATGAEGMIGGQVLDMEGEGKSLQFDELQRLHRMKTGALLTCAPRMGAIAAGADESLIERISSFGRHLGLAFQIVDDLLDVTATPEQMGKATGKDASRGKNTYPSLLGIDAAGVEAGRQLKGAIESLDGLGPMADGLRLLARFVVERKA